MDQEYVMAKWGMEMNTKSNKFWMITGDGNAPKVRQTSLGAAQQEAERLARRYPGQEFFVLEAVEVACQPTGGIRQRL